MAVKVKEIFYILGTLIISAWKLRPFDFILIFIMSRTYSVAVAGCSCNLQHISMKLTYVVRGTISCARRLEFKLFYLSINDRLISVELNLKLRNGCHLSDKVMLVQ